MIFYEMKSQLDLEFDLNFSSKEHVKVQIVKTSKININFIAHF